MGDRLVRTPVGLLFQLDPADDGDVEIYEGGGGCAGAGGSGLGALAALALLGGWRRLRMRTYARR